MLKNPNFSKNQDFLEVIDDAATLYDCSEERKEDQDWWNQQIGPDEINNNKATHDIVQITFDSRKSVDLEILQSEI